MNVFLKDDRLNDFSIKPLSEKSVVFSFIKKFYTGKDTEELMEYRVRILKAKKKEEIKEVISEAENSLETLDNFVTNYLQPGFISSFNAGMQKGAIPAAIIRSHYMSGAGKKAIEDHRKELKRIIEMGKAKLKKA